MVADFDPETSRDIYFVPVGMNYDRVLEDRVLLASGTGEKTSGMKKFMAFLRFAGRQIGLRVTGKFYRFGYASVSFGAPVSFKAFLKIHGHRKHEVMTKALGKELMAKVGAVIPILPVSLVARVFLTNQKTPLSKEDIVKKCNIVLERLLAKGAYMHIPHKDFDYAVEVGLRMLVLRHVIKEEGGKYHLQQDEVTLLGYYANAIAHLG
jgi:glycerol-3-phosphate O-acyltransferase